MERETVFPSRKGDEVSKVLRILMTAEAAVGAKGAEVAAMATEASRGSCRHQAQGQGVYICGEGSVGSGGS